MAKKKTQKEILVQKSAQRYKIQMATKDMRERTQLITKELKDWTQTELRFYVERTLKNPRNYRVLQGLFVNSIEELQAICSGTALKVDKPEIEDEAISDDEAENEN